MNVDVFCRLTVNNKITEIICQSLDHRSSYLVISSRLRQNSSVTHWLKGALNSQTLQLQKNRYLIHTASLDCKSRGAAHYPSNLENASIIFTNIEVIILVSSGKLVPQKKKRKKENIKFPKKTLMLIWSSCEYEAVDQRCSPLHGKRKNKKRKRVREVRSWKN